MTQIETQIIEAYVAQYNLRTELEAANSVLEVIASASAGDTPDETIADMSPADREDFRSKTQNEKERIERDLRDCDEFQGFLVSRLQAERAGLPDPMLSA